MGMKMCIFGAASNTIDERYIAASEAFAETVARRGHEIVFGAGANGVMGAAARGAKRVGGRLIGVIPRFFAEESIEAIYDNCDELIYTDSMRERKNKMEELADAFIILPGGIGTLEETFEVLTLKQLGRHTKPVALYNIDGFFDALIAFLHGCSEENFIRENVHKLYICSSDKDEVLRYAENTESLGLGVKDLKNG